MKMIINGIETEVKSMIFGEDCFASVKVLNIKDVSDLDMFKKSDVIVIEHKSGVSRYETNRTIALITGKVTFEPKKNPLDSEGLFEVYAGLTLNNRVVFKTDFGFSYDCTIRHATREEKIELFDSIFRDY